MTLGAGDLRLLGFRPRDRGFTIVEVLMVVAIITILFTLVIVATTQYRHIASVKATRAMIQRLRSTLDDYHRLTGRYPPDGFDSEVKNAGGVPIWGSACLYEFLSREISIEENVGGQIRTSKHDPLMQFKESELTEEKSDTPGVREIRDGFGLPLHYDNTQNGIFQAEKQQANPHASELIDDHPEDPRLADGKAAIPYPGRCQRSGSYDLWSHGSAQAHQDPETDPGLTIGNWNVDVERTEKEDKPEE